MWIYIYYIYNVYTRLRLWIRYYITESWRKTSYNYTYEKVWSMMMIIIVTIIYNNDPLFGDGTKLMVSCMWMIEVSWFWIVFLSGHIMRIHPWKTWRFRPKGAKSCRTEPWIWPSNSKLHCLIIGNTKQNDTQVAWRDDKHYMFSYIGDVSLIKNHSKPIKIQVFESTLDPYILSVIHTQVSGTWCSDFWSSTYNPESRWSLAFQIAQASAHAVASQLCAWPEWTSVRNVCLLCVEWNPSNPRPIEHQHLDS